MRHSTAAIFDQNSLSLSLKAAMIANFVIQRPSINGIRCKAGRSGLMRTYVLARVIFFIAFIPPPPLHDTNMSISPLSFHGLGANEETLQANGR